MRSQRAIVAFSTTGPNTGSFSSSRSIAICTRGDRRHACSRKYSPPPIAPNTRYQYSTKKSDRAITISVGAGRSAPKLEKTSLNAGTTNSMITATTMKATISTAIG